MRGGGWVLASVLGGVTWWLLGGHFAGRAGAFVVRELTRLVAH
jgi:hypothetical protein